MSRPMTMRLLAAVATATLLLPACGDDGANVRTIDEGGSASGSGSATGSGSASGTEASGTGTTDG